MKSGRIRPRGLQKLAAGAQGARNLEGSWMDHEIQNHAKILAKGADLVMGARKLEGLEGNSPGESMPGLHMLTSRTQKQRDARRAGERRGCFMHSLLNLTVARESMSIINVHHQCPSLGRRGEVVGSRGTCGLLRGRSGRGAEGMI